MTASPTPAQLKRLGDWSDVNSRPAEIDADTEACLAAGWLTRDADGVQLTPEGWHALKRADHLES